MLKVGVVTHYFPTSACPWEGHSAYQTLRRLSRLCDVHVFCSVVEYPRLLKPKNARAAADLTWAPPDVKVTYIPYTALPAISRPLNGFTIGRRVRPHLEAFDPDIILSYVIYPQGFAAVNLAHRLKVPAVLTSNGSDLNRISDPLCAALTRSALRRADFVSTVSQALCLKARALGADPSRSRAKRNGCDTEVFFPQDKAAARQDLELGAEQEVIVFVGRLDLRKGLSELVQAVAALSPSRPNLHCYIVGDGPDKAQLTAEAAQLGVSGAITFVPSATSGRVATWMAAADLVTLPSYNEGCPNVVIEALSCGRPVVATDVGGIPELLDQSCGRLVPIRDVPALTQALQQVLDQQWDPLALSRRNSRSWADVAHELMEVFAELLGPDLVWTSAAQAPAVISS